MIGKIAAWLLIVPSAMFCILLVELFCYLFVPSISSALPAYDGDQLIFFYDGQGAIFENRGDIFTYSPHNRVRLVTIFYTGDTFVIEYDYNFNTNNIGLVQDEDVITKRKSLLLLGDSFTEGQGAEPWFRLVSPLIGRLGYQPINGGLLATGFEQWLKLADYLTVNDISVEKVVVLFISDDYRRLVTKISEITLRCLSDPQLCDVATSYFHRLPPQDELATWIAKVREARGPTMTWLKARIATLLPASRRVSRYIKEQIFNISMFNAQKRRSHTAIAQLVQRYGRDNITFIHLPQREELAIGPNDLGLAARQAIQEAGGRLFDGFKLCGLTGADFHLHDEHPNRDGYAKIATCTGHVMTERVPGIQ